MTNLMYHCNSQLRRSWKGNFLEYIPLGKVDLTDAVLIDTLNSSLGNAKMAEILIKGYEAARPKKPYSFWDLFKGRKNVILNRASFVKHEEENLIPGEQKKPRKESAADMKEESHKFLRQALSSLFPDLPGPAAAQQSRPRAQPDRYTTTQTADKHKPDTHTTTQTADKHKPDRHTTTQTADRHKPDRHTTTQTADKLKPDRHTTTQTADKHKPTKTKVPKEHFH